MFYLPAYVIYIADGLSGGSVFSGKNGSIFSENFQISLDVQTGG